MEEEKNKDLVFNVMPQGGTEPVGNPVPSVQPESAAIGSQVGAATLSAPVNWSTGPSKTRKALYIVIGVIVLLALGGLAYYMLGLKKTDTQQEEVATTRLPKVWLQQYFNVETCLDQSTCGETADADNDGLDNYSEFKAATNPLTPDTDLDGLADGDEINIYKTEAVLKYTDRREIVATSNWTDGVQIKGGFDPLTPGLKFTDVRQQQIAADTLKFKLHEPSISTTTTAPPSSPSPSTAIPSDWKTYANAQYGFEFKYPETNPIYTTVSRSNSSYVVASANSKILYILEQDKNLDKSTVLITTTSTGLSPRKWLEDDNYIQFNMNKEDVSLGKDVKFAGHDAWFLDDSDGKITAGPTPEPIKIYVVQGNPGTLLTIAVYPKDSKTTIIDSVLSTFKFTQ